MPALRATTADVTARVRTALQAEAQLAAGNTLLSKPEQATMSAGILKDTAAAMRVAGGAGTRVDIDSLVLTTSEKIATLLGQVNQASGSGAAVVSQPEIRDLAALDAGAAVVVARAYELITGRHVDLPGAVAPPDPVVPVVPVGPVSGPLPLSGATLVSGRGVNSQLSVVATASTLELKGLAGLPASFDINVGTTPAHVAMTHGRYVAGNAMGVRDLIEALRVALPAVDVHVASFDRGRAIVEFWPAGTAPKNATPVYGEAHSLNGAAALEMTGPLATKINTGDLQIGDGIAFRVDDKVYTAVARAGRANAIQLLEDLGNQMTADGRSVVFRNYGNLGSLRITG